MRPDQLAKEVDHGCIVSPKLWIATNNRTEKSNLYYYIYREKLIVKINVKSILETPVATMDLWRIESDGPLENAPSSVASSKVFVSLGLHENVIN